MSNLTLLVTFVVRKSLKLNFGNNLVSIWWKFSKLFFGVGYFDFGIYGCINLWFTFFMGHDYAVFIQSEGSFWNAGVASHLRWVSQYGCVVHFHIDVAWADLGRKWESLRAWGFFIHEVIHIVKVRKIWVKDGKKKL